MAESPTILANEIRPNDKIFHLKIFQDEFIFSPKRFLAFVGAWGTGKDMSTIARGMRLSQEQDRNEGLIVRAEWTDLRDSTMKDFTRYTGLKTDGNNDAMLPNGSRIMFRHAEQISDEKNLNNMNLGWFGVIQADEFKDKSPFLKLCGRLRRCHGTCERAKAERSGLVPAKEMFCSCYQSGFLSANANAEDWVCELFGSPELGIVGSIGDNAGLVEAKTEENWDVLPLAYRDTIELVKKTDPPMFKRYVMNSRRVTSDQFVVIPYELVRMCVGIDPIPKPDIRRVTVCDPAAGDVTKDGSQNDGEGGGDETVVYDGENGRVREQEIYRHITLPDTEGRIMAHAKRNGSNVIMVDVVGIGAKLYQDLELTYRNDSFVKVLPFDGRKSAPNGMDDRTYANYKTYAYFKLRAKMESHDFQVPDDQLLHRQLSRTRYRYTRGVGGGRYQIIPKGELIKIIGSSPDRADALVMMSDAFDLAAPIVFSEFVSGASQDHWAAPAYAHAARVASGVVFRRPR